MWPLERRTLKYNTKGEKLNSLFLLSKALVTQDILTHNNISKTILWHLTIFSNRFLLLKKLTLPWVAFLKSLPCLVNRYLLLKIVISFCLNIAILCAKICCVMRALGGLYLKILGWGNRKLNLGFQSFSSTKIKCWAYSFSHCLYQMLPLNHKWTTGSLAPPIFYLAKRLSIKR